MFSICTNFFITRVDGANQGKKRFGMFNVKYPKMFQKRTAAAEATLASMETLEDKLDTPNDGMENVKLDMTVSRMLKLKFTFDVTMRETCNLQFCVENDI